MSVFGSSYPPGVTERDISGPDMPLCEKCGQEFNPEHEEELCEDCAEPEEEEEFRDDEGRWITGLLPRLPDVVCDTCGSDNMDSFMAKHVGDTCRQFACFGTMVFVPEPAIDFQI